MENRFVIGEIISDSNIDELVKTGVEVIIF